MGYFPTDAYQNQVTNFYELLVRETSAADIHTDADTWTIRNHVAHLIDSASNNHQRFVRLQLVQNVVFPGYEAEQWMAASDIRLMKFNQLILFWKLYNEYLIELISTIQKDCLTHTWQQEDGGISFTLEFLVRDYYSHMKVHEKMIVDIAYAVKGSK